MTPPPTSGIGGDGGSAVTTAGASANDDATAPRDPSSTRSRVTESVGRGAVTSVGDWLDQHDARRVFLVCGARSYRASGAEAALSGALSGREVVVFRPSQRNPSLEDVRLGIDLLRRTRPDVVLAVGGGTPLDVAKLVRVLAPQSADPLAIVLGAERITSPGVPLVAVPTTAGTGSEVTHFAVVYVDGIKHSLPHPWVRPDHSVVDPDLTASLSPRETAATGMDALAQAIEARWSVGSTPESDRDAEEAIVLGIRSLEGAVLDGDATSREEMARAAHLAGKAIDVTRTTAPHAISYPITSRFGVPHGHAVALTLPAILTYNGGATASDVLDPRGVDHVRSATARIAALLGAPDEAAARERLTSLLRRIGLETSLAELGIIDHDVVVREGFDPTRVLNNPRRLTEEALRAILAGDR